MKKMGIQPTDHTYTSLFNACSNSPWPADGLSRAVKLRQLMAEKDYLPNLTTYKAMIKAFGICGDLQTALSVMDEIISQHKPDVECFSSLLMACISDKESGFEHAIEVWMMMRQFFISPDLQLFNLLLRAVRECGVSSPNFIQNLSGRSSNSGQTQFIQPGNNKNEIERSSHSPLLINDTAPSSTPQRPFHQNSDVNSSDNRNASVFVNTDSLALEVDNPNSGLSFEDLKKVENRLAIVGGLTGFLGQMEQRQVQPDIRTFAQLLDVLPPNAEAENQLFSLMGTKSVKPDIDIFNMLIHKRCMRKDYELAKDVLRLIQHHDIFPNIQTFGCLAMTCRKQADGLQLIKDMEEIGLSPNLEILTTLVRTSGLNFFYKGTILRSMEDYGIAPNEKLLRIIERQITDARRFIVLKEKNETVDSYFHSKSFVRGYEDFQSFYELWLKRSTLSKEQHPWKPFRKDLKPVTNTDSSR